MPAVNQGRTQTGLVDAREAAADEVRVQVGQIEENMPFARFVPSRPRWIGDLHRAGASSPEDITAHEAFSRGIPQ